MQTRHLADAAIGRFGVAGNRADSRAAASGRRSRHPVQPQEHGFSTRLASTRVLRSHKAARRKGDRARPAVDPDRGLVGAHRQRDGGQDGGGAAWRSRRSGSSESRSCYRHQVRRCQHQRKAKAGVRSGQGLARRRRHQDDAAAVPGNRRIRADDRWGSQSRAVQDDDPAQGERGDHDYRQERRQERRPVRVQGHRRRHRRPGHAAVVGGWQAGGHRAARRPRLYVQAHGRRGARRCRDELGPFAARARADVPASTQQRSEPARRSPGSAG